MCSCGHPGTFNPAVITNKEAHMVYGNGNMNKDDEALHTASAGKKRSSHKIIKLLINFPKMENLFQVSELRIIPAPVKCQLARNLF